MVADAEIHRGPPMPPPVSTDLHDSAPRCDQTNAPSPTVREEHPATMDEDDLAEENLSAEALFRKHAPFVARFLLRLGVPKQDLEDVVQEVFLVVHNRGGYRPDRGAAPQTYFAAVALRVASNFRRRKERHTRLGGPADGELPPPPSTVTHDPWLHVQTNERLERAQSALEALDDKARVVLVLYELEGMSCDRIAAILDLPVGTVYSRLHHARRRFRTAVARLEAQPLRTKLGRQPKSYC